MSVQMLTEGWDTRTVTHVLGFRPFSTQLLCEQVTDVRYAAPNYDNYDEDGMLVAEYAEVIGVPFEFMPVKNPGTSPDPPKTRYEVHSLAGRRDLRIEFRTWSTTSLKREQTASISMKNECSVGAERTFCDCAGRTSRQRECAERRRFNIRSKSIITKLATGLVQRWCDRLADDGQGWRARRRPLFYDAMEIVKRWVELADVLDDHYDGLGSSHLAQAIREIR